MAITKVWLDEQDNQGNECTSCAEFKSLDGESHMNEKVVVFWEYDLFPYCLGGLSGGVEDGGYFRVEGYQGMRFKPFDIRPKAEGLEINRRLKELRTEYREAEQKLKDEYLEKAKQILPSIPKEKAH